MSDQIILEFIGDPSGLRPAEEALKGLSKTAQETIESFNKANEAAKKFAESAKETASSLRGIEDAAGKTIKALTSLSAIISSGAIRVISGEMKEWTSEVSKLAIEKEKLTAKLKEVKAEMALAGVAIDKGEKQYKNLSDTIKTYQDRIVKNLEAQREHNSEAEKALEKNAELKKSLEDIEKQLDKVARTTGTSSGKYKELEAESDKLRHKILETTTEFDKNISASRNLQGANEVMTRGMKDFQTVLDITGREIVSAKQHYKELANESGTLNKELRANQKAILDSGGSLELFSKGVVNGTKSISALINNSSKLIKSVGDIGAAMADASGSEKEAYEIRKKTTEILEVLSTAQVVVTAAMEGMTAATEIATAAAVGLDVALWPVSLILLAIAAGAAQVYAEFKLFMYIKDTIKPIGDAIQYLADRTRDLLSIMTKGFVDNSALHQHKVELKEIGEMHEKNTESIKKEIEFLEAQGASGEKIAARRRDQLIEEKKALEAKIEIENDATKKKELQNKLDENSIALIKNKNEAIDATAERMKQQGKSELEILTYKKQQVAEQILLNQAAIENFTIQLKTLANMPLTSAAYKQTIADMQAANEGLKIQQTAINAQISLQQNNVAKERLARWMKMNELELSLAKENSTEQINLKLAQLKKENEEELKQFKDTSEYEKYRKLLNAKLENLHTELTKKQQEAESRKNTASLEEEKKLIEAKLKVVGKGSFDEFNLKIALLEKEEEIVRTNINLTKADKDLALADIAQREKQAVDELEKIRQEERDKRVKKELEANKTVYADKVEKLKETLSKEQDSLNEELTKKNQSFTEKIEINKKYHENIEKELEDEQAALKGKYDADVNAAKDNAEEKRRIENQYVIDSKATEKKITDNKAEEGKKRKDIEQQAANQREEIAKKIGQKLIEFAKQISDAIFENQKQKRDNELKEHLDTLNARKDAELLNTTLTASQRRAIEKKYKIEEAHEKEKAWKADQKAKAEQAIINGLLAFTSALFSSPPPMNYVNAAIALASAGVQAGIILSKTPPKFAKGVVALEGPGTETSDSIAAYLSKGESVITAKATKKYAPLLEAMNAGTFTDYMPLPQMPDVSQHAEILRETSHSVVERLDYEKLGEAFARKVNLKQLNVNLDEKGFTKAILSKGNRIESYNDKMKF